MVGISGFIATAGRWQRKRAVAGFAVDVLNCCAVFPSEIASSDTGGSSANRVRVLIPRVWSIGPTLDPWNVEESWLCRWCRWDVLVLEVKAASM